MGHNLIIKLNSKTLKASILVSIVLHAIPVFIFSFTKIPPPAVEKKIRVIEIELSGNPLSSGFSLDSGKKIEVASAVVEKKRNQRLLKKTIIEKPSSKKNPESTKPSPNIQESVSQNLPQGNGTPNRSSQGSASQGKGKEATSTMGGKSQSENDLQKYVRELTRRIDLKKRYPRISQDNLEEDTVPVKLIVDSSGQLVDYQILKQSEFNRLNEATLATVKAAAPFPPLPASYEKSRLIIEVPVRFRIASR